MLRRRSMSDRVCCWAFVSGPKGNVMKILGFIGFYHYQFYDLSLEMYWNGNGGDWMRLGGWDVSTEEQFQFPRFNCQRTRPRSVSQMVMKGRDVSCFARLQWWSWAMGHKEPVYSGARISSYNSHSNRCSFEDNFCINYISYIGKL